MSGGDVISDGVYEDGYVAVKGGLKGCMEDIRAFLTHERQISYVGG